MASPLRLPNGFPPRWPGRLVFAGLAIVAACLAIGPQRAWAGELTERYFQELRQRRLFTLAEGICQRELARPGVNVSRKAELTWELSRTYAEHALYLDDRQQLELWAKAKETIDDFVQAHPEHPRRVLLETQAALVLLSQGEWLRWQATLIPFDPLYAEQARKVLTSAQSRWIALQQRAAAQVAKAQWIKPGDRKPAPSAESEDLRESEWRALLANLQYRQAQTLVELAQVLPERTPDRAAALIQAEKLLRPLDADEVAEETTWKTRLLLLRIIWLSGDAPRAKRVLEAIDRKMIPSRELDDAWMAEHARILQATRQWAEAERLIAARAQQAAPLSGELAFVHLQVLGLLWRDALRQPLAAGEPVHPAPLWKARIDQRWEQVQRDIGGFWQYRCQILYDQLQDLERFGSELAPIVWRGQADYRRGNFDEAAVLFGTARDLALKTGRRETAFKFGYQQASILVTRKRWSEAVQSALKLVEELPEQKSVGEAHLLAAFAWGKWYAEEPTEPRRTAYVAALEAVVRNYSGNPVAGEAAWLLGQHDEQRQQPATALRWYDRIPATHPRRQAGQLAIARCYQNILHRLQELGQPHEQWQREAIRHLTSLLSDVVAEPASPPGNGERPTSRTGEPLSLTQVEVALVLARFHLQQQPANYATADQWLARCHQSLGLSTPPGATAELSLAEKTRRITLQTQVAQWRVISLAGQERMAAAREELQQLSANNPQEVLRVLEGLAPLATLVPVKLRPDLGELQLAAAQKLLEQRNELSPEDRRRLDECVARGYVLTGQLRRAFELYDKLVAAAPRDTPLLTTYAETLQSCGTRDCLQRAVSQWRKVETLHMAGSVPWLTARLHACECLLELQEHAECKKLLSVTRLLYPKLGNETLKEQFLKLEKRLP